METILLFTGFFFSIMLHEIGHALSAKLLGDKTSFYLKRITLNPFQHIDKFGSVILPLILYLMGTKFMFGYAKPVIINYKNLKKPKLYSAIISICGPLVNLVLFAIFYLIYLKIDFSTLQKTDVVVMYEDFFVNMIFLNLLLAMLNLLPIPPLDGSKILRFFLPKKLDNIFIILEPFSYIILLILLITGNIQKLLIFFLEKIYYILF